MFITLLESTKQTESHGSSAFAQLLRNSIPFNSITRSLLSHSRGNYNSVPKIKPTRMPSHSIGRVNARFNGKFGLIDRRVTDLLAVWVSHSDLSPVCFFQTGRYRLGATKSFIIKHTKPCTSESSIPQPKKLIVRRGWSEDFFFIILQDLGGVGVLIPCLSQFFMLIQKVTFSVSIHSDSNLRNIK